MDCAIERRSSFASEMTDMRTMLTAGRDALMLVDEPCRGTATSDGVRLLEAILEHVPQSTACVVTTHFHELCAPTCEWMQLTAHVDEGGQCVPSYRLEFGRCTNSLALRIALAAGLPVDIVLGARAADDRDTLVISVFYKLGLQYTRMNPPATPPPTLRSAVYVLLTDEGVYVGESDRIDTRLETHRRSKRIESIFLLTASSKTEALRLESTLIHEFSYCNVALVSVADGHHDAR